MPIDKTSLEAAAVKTIAIDILPPLIESLADYPQKNNEDALKLAQILMQIRSNEYFPVLVENIFSPILRAQLFIFFSDHFLNLVKNQALNPEEIAQLEAFAENCMNELSASLNLYNYAAAPLDSSSHIIGFNEKISALLNCDFFLHDAMCYANPLVHERETRELDAFSKLYRFAKLGLLSHTKQIVSEHSFTPEEIQTAFINAIDNGQLRTAQWLYSRLNAEEQQSAIHLIKGYHYLSFIKETSALMTIQWLYLQLDPDNRTQALRAAFQNVGYSGNLALLKWFYQKLSFFGRLLLLREDKYKAFYSTIQGGNEVAVKWMLDQLKTQDKIGALSIENVFAAVKYKHTALLKWLYLQIASSATQRLFLVHNNYQVLSYALCNGDLELAEWVDENLPEYVRNDALNHNDFSNLWFALSSHDIKPFVWVYSKLEPEEQSQVLHIKKYEFFREAAKHGNLPVVKYIYERLDEKNKKAALREEGYDAFCQAAASKHGFLKTARWLLAQLSPIEQEYALVFALKKLLQKDYVSIIPWLYSMLEDDTKAVVQQAIPQIQPFLPSANSGQLILSLYKIKVPETAPLSHNITQDITSPLIQHLGKKLGNNLAKDLANGNSHKVSDDIGILNNKLLELRSAYRR